MSNRSLSVLLIGFTMWPLSGAAQRSDVHEREKFEAPAGAPPSEERIDREQVAESIIRQTNEFRTNQGLDKVSGNRDLTDAAKYFAEYMAKTNEYGHQADGKAPSERAKQHGYEYCMISENIAYQYKSTGFEGLALAERFVEGWKESPGHRKNMLEPAVVETGVAVARSDSGHWYAVQMFGRPRSASISFQITNQSAAEIEYRLADHSFTLPARYSRTHEVCQPPKVTVTLPSGEKTIEPASGDSFTVQGTEGSVSIVKQATP